MQTVRSPAELQSRAIALRAAGKRIGLVPTMGYLHEGHLSLIRAAAPRCDVIIVSIFVNPTQFGPNEDFSSYPRALERDAAMCREAGAHVLFLPDTPDIYAADHSVYVDELALGRFLCGASRPGHFRGVCTVVAKLFNLALPHVAVFGAKDAQQIRIIRRMVRDLNFPVEVFEVPTFREADGLAMSSRNARLSAAERVQATCLSRALRLAEKMYAAGTRDADEIIREMKKIIAHEPDARIDYAQVVDNETLEPVIALEKPALAALAVHFPSARLIDNAVLG